MESQLSRIRRLLNLHFLISSTATTLSLIIFLVFKLVLHKKEQMGITDFKNINTHHLFLFRTSLLVLRLYSLSLSSHWMVSTLFVLNTVIYDINIPTCLRFYRGFRIFNIEIGCLETYISCCYILSSLFSHLYYKTICITESDLEFELIAPFMMADQLICNTIIIPVLSILVALGLMERRVIATCGVKPPSKKCQYYLVAFILVLVSTTTLHVLWYTTDVLSKEVYNNIIVCYTLAVQAAWCTFIINQYRILNYIKNIRKHRRNIKSRFTRRAPSQRTSTVELQSIAISRV